MISPRTMVDGPWFAAKLVFGVLVDWIAANLVIS
jgi:hypothetical protein